MNLKIVFLATAVLVIGCGSSTNEKLVGENPRSLVQNLSLKDGPVVIFGDSLAYGTGSEHREATGQSSLDKCFSDATGRVILNKGRGGATSESALSVVDEVTDLEPAIVIVSIGGNDVIQDKYFGNYPESKTFENVSSIYQILVDSGALVVQVGLEPPVTESARLPQMSDLAAKAGVLFVGKTMAGLWENPDLMSDQIHPNDSGYSLMCDRLLKAMGPLNY